MKLSLVSFSNYFILWEVLTVKITANDRCGSKYLHLKKMGEHICPFL
jgi:hypothetical protein